MSAITKLSLVIPCYNESGRVAQMLDGLRDFVRNKKFDFEIIVVDDGSKDNTSALIEESDLYKELNAQGKFMLVRPGKNQGKGFALREGVTQASGSHILTLDADMSTRPIEVNNWVASNSSIIQQPSSILIGSRELKSSKVTERKSRNFIGKIFNVFVRLLTPLNIRDTQCGFKLYPADLAKKIFGQLKTAGWAHDVELLYRAQLSGAKITEMPVTWKAMQGSKISVGVDGAKMFFSVLFRTLLLKLSWFFVQPFSEIKLKDGQRDVQPVFRFLFALAITGLFFLMTSLSFHYGITGDDLDQKVYGEKVLNFYTSFGKDTSCLNLKVGNKENLQLYGGLFPMISAAANRYIGGLDEYDMRHLINAIAGWLAILFCGLLAKRLADWRAAFIAVLLLACFPQFFGQSMNNPKDIPFAFTYVLSIYYLVRLVQELPRPGLRTLTFSSISIALAINMRVGGILLIGMLWAFVMGAYILSKEKRKLINETKSRSFLISRMIIVSLIGYFGGLLFWPYGLVGPLSNPFSALSETTNFSMGIGLLFDGRLMMSNDIPWYYIPKWLEMITPIVVLLPFIAQAVLWFVARKKINSTLVLLVFFATLFPWAYAAYKHSPLYDGMRQMLFMLPLMCVLAALTWEFLFSLTSKNVGSFFLGIIITSGLGTPFWFMIENHPNEYVYFNEINGGIKGAYGKYDTDYYMNGIRKTSEWFKNSEMFKNASKDKKILLATNAVDPVNWYFRNDTDKVEVVFTKWDAQGNPKTRSARDWDYGIFFSRTIDPAMMLSGCFPSDKAIYKNSVDDVPLSVVIERKNKADYYGYLAMQQNNLPLADSLFHDAINYNPQNEEVALWLLQVELNLKKYDEALKYAVRYTELCPDMNYQVYQLIGQLYQQKGDMQNAQQYLNKANYLQQQMQEEQQKQQQK